MRIRFPAQAVGLAALLIPVPVLAQPEGAVAAAAPESTVGSSPPATMGVSETEGEDLVITGRRGAPPGDPLEGLNIQSYIALQEVDKHVVAPLAMGYKNALPEPLRAGVRNFFNNLAEPSVFINYLLQIKPGKAIETAGRFAINSTIGAAGLFDMAKRKPFRLPLRRNGFANTFGYYGIGPGPFLFLPLVGPTTLRDVIGLSLDKMVLPAIAGSPFNQPYYVLPATAVGSLDYRVEFDEQLRKLAAEPDPYRASREAYLASRKAEIEALRGRHAVPDPLPSTGPLVEPASPAGIAPAAASVAPAVPAEPVAPPPGAPLP